MKIVVVCAARAAVAGVTRFGSPVEPVTSVRAKLNLLGMGTLTVIYRVG
jgi:hypothetical protein